LKEKLFRIFDRCGEYSLYFFIIAIPISNAGIESFFGFILLFFLLKKLVKPDFKFLKSSTYFFALALLLFMGLSLINSGPYLAKSLIALFFKWLKNILIFVVVSDTITDPRKKRNCMIVLLGAASLICLDALFQHFVGTDFLRNKKIIPLWGETMFHGGGITASFHHYNSLGTYLVFNLSLVLSLLISVKNSLYKSTLFILLVLLQVCLFLTYSRASWLGFMFVVVLIVILYPKKRGKLFYAFAGYIFILVTCILFVIIFMPGLKERAMFADAGRFDIWKGACKMIADHPFLGIGLGTFMDHFHKYVPKAEFPVISYAHNSYLQIWAESGILALFSFILLIGSVSYNAIKMLKRNGSDFMLLGFTCAFFGFLVQLFFDSQLYSLQLAALFWFMTGVIVALTKQEETVK